MGWEEKGRYDNWQNMLGDVTVRDSEQLFCFAFIDWQLVGLLGRYIKET